MRALRGASPDCRVRRCGSPWDEACRAGWGTIARTPPSRSSRHHRTAEARRTYARELSGRASVDHVLAGTEARRRASESELTGLGEARLVELLCALECAGDYSGVSVRAFRRPG